jgi:hypothetical protein
MGDTEGHLRVVRDLTLWQVKPATAPDLPVDAHLLRDLSGSHKLKGGPQGVAKGHPQEGRKCALARVTEIDGVERHTGGGESSRHGYR